MLECKVSNVMGYVHKGLTLKLARNTITKILTPLTGVTLTCLTLLTPVNKQSTTIHITINAGPVLFGILLP